MGEFKTWGKDGKVYDNMVDKSIADRAWEIQREEQRKQNRLLAEQNRLIQQQAMESAKMEQQKMMHEQQLQSEQQKHEENMRILKLFDDIGINKESYDDFIKFLFGGNVKKGIDEMVSLEMKKASAEKVIPEIDKIIENPLEQINKYLKKVADYESKAPYPRLYPNLSNPHQDWIDGPLKKCYKEKIINDELRDEFQGNDSSLSDIDIAEINPDELCNIDRGKFIEYQQNIISASWATKIFSVALVISIIFLIIFLSFYGEHTKIIISEEIDAWAIIIPATIIVTSLIALPCIIIPNKDNKIKMYYLLIDETTPGQILDEEKIIKTFKRVKKEYNQIDETILQAQKKTYEALLPKWEDFINFRKSHYNSKIEKLLLDLNLKEQVVALGADYPKINNGNKTGDGTIEDYIEYFDNLSE